MGCLSSQVPLPFSSSIDPDGKARHLPHHWTNSFLPTNVSKVVLTGVNEMPAIEAVSEYVHYRVFVHSLSTPHPGPFDPNNRYNSQASSTASPHTRQNHSRGREREVVFNGTSGFQNTTFHSDEEPPATAIKVILPDMDPPRSSTTGSFLLWRT